MKEIDVVTAVACILIEEVGHVAVVVIISARCDGLSRASSGCISLGYSERQVFSIMLVAYAPTNPKGHCYILSCSIARYGVGIMSLAHTPVA